MTNLITLTIPNDDHIALRAFGKALEEMALAQCAEPSSLQLSSEPVCTVSMLPEQENKLRERLKTVLGEPQIDTTAQQVESLAVPGATHIITEQKLVGGPEPVGNGNFSQGYIATVEEIADPVDSTGTPWDEHIHSASKALNTDGTWRLRRKPKDMDEAEWAAFVETVKSELHTQTPVMTDEEVKTLEPVETVEPTSEEIDEWEKSKQPDYLPEPPVTPPGDDFHTDEQTVAGIPPLPVPPPVVVAPPAPEVTAWDFPKLMTFLTERHGKIDVAMVNTLLAQDGMSSVQELNAHPDKIGPFVARVKAHLGE